jgi:hypothetical protein
MRHTDFYETAHSRNRLINVWWRGGEETFESVIFSSYEIEEAIPCWGETSARLGSASRERLDGAIVEVLAGEKV